MGRFLVYNAEGKSLVVDANIGERFSFYCSEEECGTEIIIEGIIRHATFEEFIKVRNNVIEQNEEFKVLGNVIPKEPMIFEGTVNGKKVELPAEKLDEVAKRFIDRYLNL
ncbi:hypothetical protein E3E31_02195 [Thermococcus sp. M39]|uniref:hypothetical protein n=1 Tax=unclassified Thermococcus TaxID=2627626 RepID=UPI0014389AA2|nr:MULTISPECIES: hypothetical protein [unclassified Thermococcus]NJE07358.1 hypothetical protein [Thermococcus sp. M39]NJE12511.1 hypothetical protein [Thermococcus sp. LS2]